MSGKVVDVTSLQTDNSRSLRAARRDTGRVSEKMRDEERTRMTTKRSKHLVCSRLSDCSNPCPFDVHHSDPLHPIKFIPESDMVFPYCLEISFRNPISQQLLRTGLSLIRWI